MTRCAPRSWTTSLAALLLVFATSTHAGAQEAPPAPAPAEQPPPPPATPPPPPGEPQAVEPQPQPYYAPSPGYYAPPAYAPAPYAIQVDPAELERRGRTKKVVGAVFMGLGTALSIVGIGLTIDGGLHAECHGHEEHATCKPSPALTEFDAGAGALFVGQVLTIVGIPVYIVGGRQVARARRLAGQVSLQPLVGSAGAGAAAQLRFRF
jgi:hypothetical protein